MFSRHLILKLYLWLLLALSLSVAGAGAVFTVLSPESFEERAREFVQDELGSVRDAVEALLRQGLSPQSLRDVLGPLGRTHQGAWVVLRADGDVVVQGESSHHMGRGLRLSEEDRDEVREHGVMMRWEGRGRALVALPLALPDGGRGIFAVSFMRFRWGGVHAPLRMVAGLAVVLGVLWLLSWPLAAHLARPLQRMALAADALGQGDLSVRIAPTDIQRRHRHRPRRDEIGRLAESFNRMAANLERLILGHKQLLQDISHELRSPLARLRLALELARGAEGTERAEYLAVLERQADTMEEMIAELLFHARLDEAPYSLHTESLELGAVVREVLSAQRPETEARRIALRTHLPQGMPAMRLDRTLLSRALSNAVRNAIAYSPEDGAVDVTLRRESGRLLLTVRDEGPGVPPEQLQAIFEPFLRTDAARSRGTGGVGLGLAIVRRCMQAHGGDAYAAAGPGGKGLLLTLWLPEPGVE